MLRISSFLYLAAGCVLGLLAAEPSAQPKSISGKVVAVADGDTLTVLDGTTQVKVRLEGIDAPESGQDFGTAAKKALSGKVFGKVVRVEWRDKDKYGRTLGHVHVDGRHVNLELVQEGMAWHYKEYNSDKALADAETKAREAKRGLWSIANPIPPWDFRHGQKNAPVTKGAIPERLGKAPREPAAAPTSTSPARVRSTIDGCRSLADKIPTSLEEAREKYSPCSFQAA
jgi:endonuclease YncB( thermonuclease family)